MQHAQSQLFTSRVFRLRDVMSVTGLSRSTIYDKQNTDSPRYDPSFPKKIHLGARAVGWMGDEIIAWVDAMRAQPIKGGE